MPHTEIGVGELLSLYCPEHEHHDTYLLRRGSMREPVTAAEFPEVRGLIFCEQWATRHRAVYCSAPRRVIVTWIEGDLTVEEHHTLASYEAAMERARKFYEGAA